MSLYRVLVTGDRNWTDSEAVYAALTAVRAVHGDILVIHGGAQGADTIAHLWALKYNSAVAVFPAQWDRHHRAAGPIRNQQMLNEMKPDEVLAFHDNIEQSRGTKDMVARARKVCTVVLNPHKLEDDATRATRKGLFPE
jgi:predicted Rossmann fold nucleotide-binding protein DprA/Smf involved in DNA uptake